MKITRKYDEAAYLAPYWSGDVVLHESVMFLGDERRVKLMYPADEILGVFSADLSVEYREGVDYALEDGCFVRLEGGSIPVTTLEEYFPANNDEKKYFSSAVEGHKYIWFGKSAWLYERQTAVTYRHSAKWDGPVPKHQPDKFARFMAKCRAGGEVTALFYGDSITTGCNTTGMTGVPPYTPTWCEMVVSALGKITGNGKIKYVNTAVGGRDSRWGLAELQTRVLDHKPDLLIHAFGMNDGGKPGEEYMELNREMIDKVRAELPGCDICLVSTTLPHWRVAGFFGHQPEFEPLLAAYAEPLPNVGIVPMTSLHAHILKRKEFYSFTGNNVNHPNDFQARLYAQAILAAVAGVGAGV